MTNIEMTQLQIKAFNKALSRADKANLISDDIYAAISDLIDPERMTKSGYAMAGKKYLESMSTEELLAYSSDIQAAKDLMEISKLSNQIDISAAKDPKGLLWGLYQKLEDAGLGFDSDPVDDVLKGNVNVSVKDLALKMNKYLTDENYGLSDFKEWFNSQATLGQEW